MQEPFQRAVLAGQAVAKYPEVAAFAVLDAHLYGFLVQELSLAFDGEQDLMIAARKGSPLAIGHGEGEVYVGSDAIALAPMTDRIT